MPAKKTYPGCQTGFTIIEMMVTILVLAIIVIGTAGYRYYSALDARKAVKEADAARVALMLLESWRAHQGNPLFDPAATTNPPLFNPNGFITGPSGSFPLPPSDGTAWTPLGSYAIRINSVNPSESALTYYATLSYNNVLKPDLRILNATVAWPISIEEKNYTTSGNYWTVTLTTYAEN